MDKAIVYLKTCLECGWNYTTALESASNLYEVPIAELDAAYVKYACAKGYLK
jgi:hypothetical protein